jgi:hypothetical protein
MRGMTRPSLFEPQTRKGNRNRMLGMLLLVCGVSTASGQDTYSYDRDGTTVGLSSTVNGLRLSVQNTNGVISAPGLPTLTMILDGSRRIEFLNGPSGPLLTYSYHPDGSVESVQLPWDLTLKIAAVVRGMTTEVVEGSNGRVLTQVNVKDDYGHGRWHLLNLDLFLATFGLGDDWFNSISVVYNTTSTVVTVNDSTGAPLFYLLRFGTVNVGFDLAGNGLFYDLDVAVEVTEKATTPSRLPPVRIIVARDQRVEVQSPWAADGAVESLWVDRDRAGTETLHARTVEWTQIGVHAYCGSATDHSWDAGGKAVAPIGDYYRDSQ